MILRKIALVMFMIIFSIVIVQAHGHKPIQSDQQNTTIENALKIPDHKISWVIYEELGPYQKKFYQFEANKGDSFYASIVIPKLERQENYKPSLGLVFGDEIKDSYAIQESLAQDGLISNYEGVIPSKEFYEPFGQATYWERQEIKINIPKDGVYYLVVFDTQGIDGKLSLAIGTIEDFTFLDFFTVLPLAWIDTKFFFEDYLSLSIFFGMIASIPALLIVRKLKIKRSIKLKNK